MKRFYVPRSRWKDGRAQLSREQCIHVLRVLRMKQGDMVAIFDGEREYEARLAEVNKGGVWCEIEKSNEKMNAATENRTAPIKVILAPALLKAKRMDIVIEKATELGVNRIAPFVAERSVVKPNPARATHWVKIAESAAAQSGHIRVPEIAGAIGFEEILEIDADLKVMLWESEKEHGVEKILAKWSYLKDKKPSHLILMVGPEGGFTNEEALAAQKGGFLSWGLGSPVLRAETASIVGISILIHTLFGRLY